MERYSKSYAILEKKDILAVLHDVPYDDFVSFVKEKGSVIKLPWGDVVYDISPYLVDQEDTDLQEQVFTDCSLEIQNLIFSLKQYTLSHGAELNDTLCYAL